MRRYLDDDFATGSVTTKNLKNIRKKILNRYGIDLKKIAEGESQYKEFENRIAQKWQLEGTCYDIRSLLFLQDDLEEFGENLHELQLAQGNIIRAGEIVENENRKEEDGSELSEEQILKLYEKMTGVDEIAPIEGILSLKECVSLIKYMVSKSRIFDMDYILQFFARHKYTQVSAEKYSYYEDREKERIDIRSRLKDIQNFPMRDSNHLPIFIKELQDILFKQRYLRIFEFGVFGSEREREKGSADITRYSYKYVEEIYSKIKEKSMENVYYLNDMLGISLTNTIFECVYANTQKQSNNDKSKLCYGIINEKVFDVATLLGKLKCIYGRDILAKIVFRFLFSYQDQEKEIEGEEKMERMYQDIGSACDQACGYLQTEVDQINQYFDDLCDARVWMYEYNRQSELGLDDEFSERIQDSMIWMKNHIENEVVDNIMGSRTIRYEDDYRIKKMKMIKKPDNLYAQIHMAVMRGIWE